VTFQFGGRAPAALLSLAGIGVVIGALLAHAAGGLVFWFGIAIIAVAGYFDYRIRRNLSNGGH
jgi:hypothetical protein